MSIPSVLFKGQKMRILLMSALLLSGCAEPDAVAISRVPYSDGHCTLMNNGMVIIETTAGRDALPVNLVSQELVDAFVKDIESKKEPM
jgi:hypothetical protein